WSSTARIRIGLEPVLTASLSPFSKEQRSARSWRLCIGSRCRDGQLGLGSRIEFAPHRQLSANQLGALLHAWETIVSHATTGLENLRVNALPVVPDAHSKLPLVIADFHLDAPRLCVPEGVA